MQKNPFWSQYHWSKQRGSNNSDNSKYKWVKKGPLLTDKKVAVSPTSVLPTDNRPNPESVNKISQECSKMIERLNKAAKTISDYTKATGSINRAPSVKTTNTQCERCIKLRLAKPNPYQFIRCQCKIVTKSNEDKNETISKVVPDTSDPKSEQQISTCQGDSSIQKLSTQQSASMPNLSTQQKDSQKKRRIIRTRYKVDRRSVKTPRTQRNVKQIISPSNNSESSLKLSIMRRRRSSSCGVIRNRYTLDRRPKYLKSKSNRSSCINGLSPQSISLRRKMLRDQGFVVSKFKVRRKSWIQARSVSSTAKKSQLYTDRGVSSVWMKCDPSIARRSSLWNQQQLYRNSIGRAKLRLINRKPNYCIQFIRKGFCTRRDQCRLLHDSNTVRLCPRYLSGHCESPSCALAHTRDKNRLPLCTFFERGVCSRGPECPYLHVKLPPDTRVCVDFQWSYCRRGAKCQRRHVLGTRSYVRRDILHDPNKVDATDSKIQEVKKRPESDSYLPLLSDSEEEDM